MRHLSYKGIFALGSLLFLCATWGILGSKYAPTIVVNEEYRIGDNAGMVLKSMDKKGYKPGGGLIGCDQVFRHAHTKYQLGFKSDKQGIVTFLSGDVEVLHFDDRAIRRGSSVAEVTRLLGVPNRDAALPHSTRRRDYDSMKLVLFFVDGKLDRFCLGESR